MKHIATSLLLFLLCASARADQKLSRPRILGIAFVRIQVSDVNKGLDFYSMALGTVPRPTASRTPCDWCEVTILPAPAKHNGPIELEKAGNPAPPSLVAEIALLTDDAGKLRNYLKANHIAANKLGKCGLDACFSLLDPEQHRITFVQRTPMKENVTDTPFGVAHVDLRWFPIIHAGFVVRDRAAEDKFYKDLLGFHVYWHGGRTDDETSWVDMQVPDGTDWIEYMLNVSPEASHKTLGVMNHIALGVPDIHAAQEQLIKNGWKANEEPKIGRDGKWQLNLYDPDETRVELMEFKPTKEPCCSPYTGPHPGPSQ